jgi:hypothetical protein
VQLERGGRAVEKHALERVRYPDARDVAGAEDEAEPKPAPPKAGEARFLGDPSAKTTSPENPLKATPSCSRLTGSTGARSPLRAGRKEIGKAVPKIRVRDPRRVGRVLSSSASLAAAALTGAWRLTPTSGRLRRC